MKINSIKTAGGFTLIEVIVYSALLSVLTIGIFSSTFSLLYFEMQPAFDNNAYESLIHNYHIPQ